MIIFEAIFPTPVLMQSLMGVSPKTALHRYSLLPTPYSLFPVPCSLFPVPFAI
ncbi:hypothetical protein [Moorena sp. SIO3H5]|uniref:hypothetical protein n=1 Tax=Moorena sp. SIO3H5 TaxID=2607834 RepID=UPI0013BAFC66|nr:hypothetical protein [Moorena sp. SIO3H5]NEO71320.1 hypothetical protein [Moorena sp. SIO3H5]